MSNEPLTVGVRVPRCRHCQSPDDLFQGDGAIVCRPCLTAFGNIAADPHKSDNRVLTELLKRHGDVVSLERIPTGQRGETKLVWAWTDTWPQAEKRP